MNKSQTRLRIREDQRLWADAHNLKRDGDSVLVLENNLYQPLTPKTLDQYKSGDGDELGQNGRRGKMFSLRSSRLSCATSSSTGKDELSHLF